MKSKWVDNWSDLAESHFGELRERELAYEIANQDRLPIPPIDPAVRQAYQGVRWLDDVRHCHRERTMDEREVNTGLAPAELIPLDDYRPLSPRHRRRCTSER